MVEERRKRLNWTSLKAFFYKNLKPFLNKDWNVAAGAAIVVFFLSYLAAHHYIQVNQGIGLYFSIYFDSANKFIFDILADVIRFFTVFVAILIPCVLFKRYTIVSYLHILEIYLAFMPVTHLNSIIHYFSTEVTEWVTFLHKIEWCQMFLPAIEQFLKYLPTITWCLTYPAVIFLFYWMEKLYENVENGKIWSKAFDILLILSITHKLLSLKHYIEKL